MAATKTKRIASKARAGGLKRKRPAPLCKRNRPAKAADVARRPTGLFTVRLGSKPAITVDPELLNGAPVSKLFADLQAAYLRYCKLLKVPAKPLDAVETVAIPEMLEHVRELAQIECKSASVDIDFHKDSNEYLYTITRYYQYNQELFVFPLEFLHYLRENNSALYEPMVRFCGWWLFRLGYPDWNNNYYTSVLVDMMLERAEEYAEDEPAKALEIINDAARYQKDGFASFYLKQLRQFGKMPDASFISEIRNLKLTKEFAPLRDWILEGIAVMKDKRWMPIANMQFDRQYFNEHDDDYESDGDAVRIEDQFVVLWSVEDYLYSEYQQYVNEASGNSGSYDPMEWWYITARTQKPYKINEWPNELRFWINTGMAIVFEYCDRERKARIGDNEFIHPEQLKKIACQISRRPFLGNMNLSRP